MLKKLTQKRNKKGFTLVELVVVIAILGILAAIAVPRLSGYQDKAKLSADKATAASIGKAVELYGIENDDMDGTLAEADFTKLKEAKLIKDKDLKSQLIDGTFTVTYSKTDGTSTVLYAGSGATIGKTTYTELYPEVKSTTTK